MLFTETYKVYRELYDLCEFYDKHKHLSCINRDGYVVRAYTLWRLVNKGLRKFAHNVISYKEYRDALSRLEAAMRRSTIMAGIHAIKAAGIRYELDEC